MYSLLTNKAFDFISPHENKILITYISYWDGGDRYSIGFGNISYPGEIIDYDEAVIRCKDYIQKDINELENQTWFSILSDEKKIAVLDFAYQAGKYGDKFRNLQDKIVSSGVTENDFKTGYENQSRVNNRWHMFNSSYKVDLYTASLTIPFLVLFTLAILKKLLG